MACVPGAKRGAVNTMGSPNRQGLHTSDYLIQSLQGLGCILLGQGLVPAWVSLDSYGGRFKFGQGPWWDDPNFEDPGLTGQR